MVKSCSIGAELRHSKNRTIVRRTPIVRISAIIVLALMGAMFFGESAQCQTTPSNPPVSLKEIGFPWDWSHEHVIFTGTTEPRILDKTQQDPRLLHRWLRQNLPALQAKAGSGRFGAFPGWQSRDAKDSQNGAMKRTGFLGRLAAALNTGLATTVHAAPSDQAPRPETLPLTAAVVWSLEMGAVILGLSLGTAFLRRRHWLPTLMVGVAIGLFLLLDSCAGAGTATSGPTGATSKTQALKADWNTTVGTTTLGATQSGAPQNSFPAKYTFNVTATPSCTSDYVVFPTGANGSSSQPSVLGINELYATQGSSGGQCAQNGPSVAWAYINAACSATTSSDPIWSSPTLSLDGTKVAWVTRTGKVQVLTIGTTGSNGAAATNGATNPPAAVCIGGATNNAALRSVTLNGAPAVSNSSVFVDYTNDIGYVGDDNGKLHKITPFFSGTPAEVTTGGWPVTVSSASTAILTPPVWDSVSGDIYIGDNENSAGNLFYVRTSVSSSGSCSSGSPPCLGSTTVSISNQQGLADAPVVDSTNGWIYEQTANADGTNAKIYQASATLTTVSSANVGGPSSLGGGDLHSGSPDNTYFTSGPTASGASYYVCGLDSGGTDSGLYRFGFSNSTGKLNSSPSATLVITTAGNSPCSPITEIYNPNASGGAADWLFLGVTNNGVPASSGCSGNPCVFQFNITNAPATLSVGQFAQLSQTVGISGIIVDNVSTLSETSNIYFAGLGSATCTTGGTGVCATKMHQSNLQ